MQFSVVASNTQVKMTLIRLVEELGFRYACYSFRDLPRLEEKNTVICFYVATEEEWRICQEYIVKKRGNPMFLILSHRDYCKQYRLGNHCSALYSQLFDDYFLNKVRQRLEGYKTVFQKFTLRGHQFFVRDVIYIERCSEYYRNVKIVLDDHVTRVRFSLKQFEQLTQAFIRCHQSYLVNPTKVLRFDRQNGLLELVNGESILVSRPHYPEFSSYYFDKIEK